MTRWLAAWRPSVVPGLLLGGGVFLMIAGLAVMAFGEPWQVPAHWPVELAGIAVWAAGNRATLAGLRRARGQR